MTRLGDAPESFTTVYVAQRGLLAIFSSTKLATWMAELHDALPLSVLSIPGTHNSPTYRVALPSVRCQAVSVREQLDNGVRFLDVRVSAGRDDDNMTLVHSAFPVSLTGARYLADLLTECYAFLDAHPREALLVSVKREGTGRASDQQMARHLHARFVDRDPARWIDVRRAAGGEFGIDGQSWPDNCEDGAVSSGLVRVQDFYGVGLGTTVEKKISYSCAQLERAASMAHEHEQNGTANGTANGAAANGAVEAAAAVAAAEVQAVVAAAVPPLFVNFLTASNFFNATCWPERIAAKVNPRIVEYLCARHAIDGAGERGLSVGHGGTGIVVTDWVGAHGDWDLIRCVVGMNARLIGKK
ncbi:unnamed protein product [Parascedosporium putredinis]|uniref:Phosphatidylinositol-specific phospholipase C X domain-containing protein n=1 Tax=Parascedosporium putredinis TaxID=1442378 RepID=A0A9P1GZE4_9PEZI|nr:unnamed protein product [Parascedosporium putredinis]CAI7992822.1 unnamed protein product [Parascedosporium putredinis]